LVSWLRIRLRPSAARRRLNVKALLILLLSVAVLGVGAYSLHAYQVQRNAHALLAQASREEDKGDLGKALVYLKTYLGFRRDDIDARERFALILSRVSQRPRDLQVVLDNLERVLQQDPQRHDVRRKAIELYLQYGRPKDALAHLEQLQKPFPDNPDDWEKRGQAEAQLQHFEKAVKAFDEAVHHDPGRVRCYVAQADLFQTRLGQPDVADRVMQAMTAANKDSGEALKAWVQYQNQYKGPTEREKARQTLLEQVEKLAADDPDVLLLAAEMEMARESPDLEAARGFLQRGLQQRPTDFRYYQQLARVEMAAGRRDEALACLRRGLAQLPDQLATVGAAADLCLDAGAVEEANRLIARIPRDELTAGVLDYLSGRVAMARQSWADALPLLQRAREELHRLPPLLQQACLLVGECHRQLGNPDQQLAACRAALEVDHANLTALLAHAAAVMSLGRLDEAAKLYAALADRAPEARLTAVRLALASNRGQPGHAQRFDDAAELLNKAPAAVQDKADFRVARIELLLAQGKNQDARRQAEAGCAAFPSEPGFWLALVELANREKHPERIPDLLTRAEKAAGDCAAIRLAWLRHYQASGKDGRQAQEYVQRVRARPQLPPKEEAAWLSGLYRFQLSAASLKEAKQTLDRLAALQPRDVTVRLSLVELAAAGRDAEQLKSLTAQLRSLEGEQGTFWRYALAVSLLAGTRGPDRADRDRSRKLLEEVAKHQPSWAAPLRLQGAIHDMDGNLEGAMHCYQRAVDLGETRVDVVRRLVELYQQHRQYAEAQKVLQKVPWTSGQGGLGQLAAQVALSVREDPEQTLQLAVRAAPSSSRDYRDHLWLGQMLVALKKPQDGEKELRRAVELGPKSPDTWVALVQFLSADGREQEARGLIPRAAAALPSEATPLALAACYEAVGDRDAAAREYQQALTAAAGDLSVHHAKSLFHLRGGEAEKAATHLTYLANSPKATPAQAAWARRTLALLLASGGDYQRSTEALALLEKNVRERRATAEDRRAVALIQARRPGGRREAIRSLEAAFLQVPPSDDERFLLAYLYAASRDWPRARGQFLRVLTAAAGPNLGHLAVFVHLLIEQRELDDAEHWLAELQKAEPKELRTLALEARLHHARALKAPPDEARKENERAVTLLKECAAAAAQDPARQLAVGQLLEQLGYSAEAGPYFEAYARLRGPKDPAGLIPWVTYLGRQNRLKEALDLCEQLQARVPDETLAHVWIGCLRSGKPDAEHCSRAENWIRLGLQKQPTSAVMTLSLANLRDLQDRPEEAEKIYRELLQRDPRNVVAGNNLAALLAFRSNQGGEALEVIQRALDSGGPLPDLLDTRACVYMALGRWSEAVRDLEEVVSQDPNPASYLRLARALAMAGERQAALAALGKARAAGGGLKLSDLHPLERPVYDRFVHELDKNGSFVRDLEKNGVQ
jgi:tetratricopeptide (TPR) repeat protein